MEEIQETVLSPWSLGLAVKKKICKKSKSPVKKVRGPSYRYTVRFDMVLPPALEWFASRWANYTFGISRNEIDPEWYQELVPESFNPSIWLNKRRNLYTLRVPKYLEIRTTRYLQKKKFWYNSKTNTWLRRRGFKME